MIHSVGTLPVTSHITVLEAKIKGRTIEFQYISSRALHVIMLLAVRCHQGRSEGFAVGAVRTGRMIVGEALSVDGTKNDVQSST